MLHFDHAILSLGILDSQECSTWKRGLQTVGGGWRAATALDGFGLTVPFLSDGRRVQMLLILCGVLYSEL